MVGETMLDRIARDEHPVEWRRVGKTSKRKAENQERPYSRTIVQGDDCGDRQHHSDQIAGDDLISGTVRDCKSEMLGGKDL